MCGENELMCDVVFTFSESVGTNRFAKLLLAALQSKSGPQGCDQRVLLRNINAFRFFLCVFVLGNCPVGLGVVSLFLANRANAHEWITVSIVSGNYGA